MCLVTAHEAGIGDKLQRTEAPVNPAKINEELVRQAPLGKVPVLITDHGHALFDSRVIIEYLCHVSGNRTLIPDDGVKRFRILTLQALGQGMAESAVGYRYETAARPAGLQWEGWIERTKSRINASLDDLEANWISFLAEPNAGSIATAVTLSYMDFRLPDWKWCENRPKLKLFHEDFSSRSSMIETKLNQS